MIYVFVSVNKIYMILKSLVDSVNLFGNWNLQDPSEEFNLKKTCK